MHSHYGAIWSWVICIGPVEKDTRSLETIKANIAVWISLIQEILRQESTDLVTNETDSMDIFSQVTLKKQLFYICHMYDLGLPSLKL